ncbi:MAG: recombination protein NinG [Staphylococcus sp.]|nr:recombination protein NinG [Staphylococcus sp.]
MPEIRKCDGCSKLNKRKKNEPCELGFNCVFDKTKKVFIRPSKCKKKIVKEDPKKELKKYKERAIDAFQKWIRYRDNFTCVVCGFHIDKNDKQAFSLIHAGHFISRKIEQLLLDPKNCHGQCRTCNYLQDKISLDPRYIIYLFNKFGVEIFNYFDEKIRGKHNKYELEDWKKLAEYWENQLKEIKEK